MQVLEMNYGLVLLFVSVILLVWGLIMLGKTRTNDGQPNIYPAIGTACAFLGGMMTFPLSDTSIPFAYPHYVFGLLRTILAASLIANIIVTIKYRKGDYA